MLNASLAPLEFSVGGNVSHYSRSTQFDLWIGFRVRLLDIAIEKVDPAFVPVVNPDQSGTTIQGANA